MWKVLSQRLRNEKKHKDILEKDKFFREYADMGAKCFHQNVAVKELIQTFRSKYEISSIRVLFPANFLLRGQVFLEVSSSRQRVCLNKRAHACNTVFVLVLILGSEGLC